LINVDFCNLIPRTPSPSLRGTKQSAHGATPRTVIARHEAICTRILTRARHCEARSNLQTDLPRPRHCEARSNLYTDFIHGSDCRGWISFTAKISIRVFSPDCLQAGSQWRAGRHEAICPRSL